MLQSAAKTPEKRVRASQNGTAWALSRKPRRKLWFVEAAAAAAKTPSAPARWRHCTERPSLGEMPAELFLYMLRLLATRPDAVWALSMTCRRLRDIIRGEIERGFLCVAFPGSLVTLSMEDLPSVVPPLAAEAGNLALFVAARDAGCRVNGFSMSMASKAPNPSVLNLLIDANACVGPNAVLHAAHNNRGVYSLRRVLHYVSWRSVDRSDCRAAWERAPNAHLMCALTNNAAGMRLLRSYDIAFHAKTCSTAAAFGSLETLRFAVEEGAPRNYNAAMYAAANGHPACLEYLLYEGFYMDDSVCTEAARGGHMACLRVALEAGCPCNENALLAAINARHDDVVDFLSRGRCDYGDKASEAARCSGQEMLAASLTVRSFLVDDCDIYL